MSKEKFDNETIIRWGVPSYAALETKELDKLPKQIQKMIVDHLLHELNIPISIHP